MVECHEFKTPWETSIWHTGARLSAGLLPALFYFSLSGKESLCLAPYNSPVSHLQGAPLRIFSLTLPGHEPGCDPTKALGYWAEELARGNHLIEEFLEETLRTIDHLIDQGIIDPKRLATAGLSRGGLIATHLAARDSRIRAVCGFAPWTDPSYSPEFQPLAEREEVRNLALRTLTDRLTHTPIRFYVGNRDAAVGTEVVFAFIHELAEHAFQQRVRSPHAELIITPSIGHRGHGTPEASFHTGADWLKDQLLHD